MSTYAVTYRQNGKDKVAKSGLSYPDASALADKMDVEGYKHVSIVKEG